jgi:hypothetical protein
VTPSILAKPIESQPAEITQLFLSQPLRAGREVAAAPWLAFYVRQEHGEIN